MELYGATVGCSFYSTFLVSTENLKVIEKIIRLRFADEVIQYKVVRHLGAVYYASTLDDVVSDENRRASRIRTLIVSVESDNLKLCLSFHRGSASYLSVEGPNRDLVDAIYEDLRRELISEVFNKIRFTKLLNFKLLPTLALGSLFIVIFYLMYAPQQVVVNREELMSLIESDDISNKLDFLLERHLSSASFENMTLHMYIIIGIYALLVLVFWSIFSPRGCFALKDTFLIGQEINEHNRRIKTRSNFFWGVLVATAVCIAGGFFVYYMTNQ